MKKAVSILLAVMMVAMFSFSVMAEVPGWQCDNSEGSTLSASSANLPVMTGVVGGLLSALYTTPVSFDGFTAEVAIDRSVTGWLGIGFKDAAKGIGGTDVASFGNGLFIICQKYDSDPTRLTAIVYSIDSKGFASGTSTLGVISNVSFDKKGTVKIKIVKDATLGYKISINDSVLKKTDGSDIDLSFLKAFFTDDKGYFAVGDLSVDAVSKLEVKSITLAGSNTTSNTTGNTETADNMPVIAAVLFIGFAGAFIVMKARKIKE